jgi:hypothetical protein
MPIWLNSTQWDLSFDMSHNTLRVTFWFCTQWPPDTPGLNSTHQNLSFDMSHDTLHVTCWILHSMTPEHPWAELYPSRPFIWYVTWYPLGNFLILHSMTPDTPGLNSAHWDLSFDMSNDTLHVTFWFCTQWPLNTPWLNSTHRDLSFDMLHDTLRVTFWFWTQWPWNTPRLTPTRRDLPFVTCSYCALISLMFDDDLIHD